MRVLLRSTVPSWAIFLILPIAVRASGDLQGSAPQSLKEFRIGYTATAFSDIRPEDAEVALEMWGDTVREKMEGETETVKSFILEDRNQLLEILRSQQYELLILDVLNYMSLEPGLGLEPVLVPSCGGEATHRYVLLTNAADGIEQLYQLRGKRLLIESGGQGGLPHIWIDSLALEQELPEIASFFRPVSDVHKASQAVLPIFFRQAGSCVVTQRSFDTICELNPQVRAKVKVLERSVPLLRGLLCMRQNMPAENYEKAMEILRNLHKEPAGQQMLLMFQEEELVPWDPTYIKSAVALIEHHRRLRDRSAPTADDEKEP